MSSVNFKFLAMPNVDFKMRVSSVELKYRVPSVRLILECQMSGVRKYPFMGHYDSLNRHHKQTCVSLQSCSHNQAICSNMTILVCKSCDVLLVMRIFFSNQYESF